MKEKTFYIKVIYDHSIDREYASKETRPLNTRHRPARPESVNSSAITVAISSHVIWRILAAETQHRATTELNRNATDASQNHHAFAVYGSLVTLVHAHGTAGHTWGGISVSRKRADAETRAGTLTEVPGVIPSTPHPAETLNYFIGKANETNRRTDSWLPSWRF